MLSRIWKGQWDAVAIASVVLLALSLVLGGASRDHALRLAVVELAALPVLALGLERLLRNGLWRQHTFPLTVLGAVAAIPLAQLIPLPPMVWAALPGRDEMVLALQLTGVEPGWAPLSLSPDHTGRSALALIPPAAFFIAMLSMSGQQRERLVHLCVAGAILGILLGAAQLASGGERLYPWATTAAGSVTGFFANRNHLASYVLVTLPFAVILGAATLRRNDRSTLGLWFGALFMGLAIVALAAIRSRGGIIFFVPVMVVSLLGAWIAAGRGRPGPGLLVFVGSIAAALTAVAILALPPILARFDTQGTREDRFQRWPLIAEAAQT